MTAFLSAGCAHKPAASPQAVSQNLLHSRKGEVHTANPEPASADSDMEDLDDDFFDDEFEKDPDQIADPLSMWNRAMFHFNDKLYFWALKPLARGYKAVTPDFFRTGVKNFFQFFIVAKQFQQTVILAFGLKDTAVCNRLCLADRTIHRA